MRAVRGERTPQVPVWLMRQAGRTDPAYLRLKEEAGLPLEEMFRHAELAARTTLLPRRMGVDALIYFQDILTPLGPMGAPFLFRPGPVLESPIRTASQVRALHTYDVVEALPFIPEIFRLVREELDGAMPVLGFAGAPFTLAVFLIEGRSFGARAEQAQAFLDQEPALAHELLERLTEMTVDYLRLQIRAGAAAVQLFESAAYLLSPAAYRTFALPYQQRIFESLRGSVPTIAFARERDEIELLDEAGADVISLPSSIGIDEARARLGAQRVVQGNVSNRLLARGSREAIADSARACVRAGGGRGHIFNLDHGLLRETPFGNILHLIRTVHGERFES